MSRSLYARLHRRFGVPLADSERFARIEAKLRLDRTYWRASSLPPACNSRLSDTTVAIVGGGFAGLSAAWSLCQHEPRVMITIFEAGSEVGGRVSTDKTFTKNRIVEAGAELIGANHPMWIDLTHEFGLGLNVLTTEDHYARAGLETKFWIDKLISRDDAKKLEKQLKEKILKPIGLDAKLIKDPSQPWLQSILLRLDRISVADKLAQLGFKKGDVLWKAMALLLGNNNLAALEEMNYLGLLCLVKGGQFGPEDKDLLGYWQETEVFRCADGNQTLATKMAAALENPNRYKCKILRKTAVETIDIGKHVTLTLNNLSDGKRLPQKFDYVILAIPPSVWGNVAITPSHPRDAIGLIGMGPAVKFLSNVADRFWITEKAAPSGASSKVGMIWEGTDNQTLLGEQGIELSVFAGGPNIPTKAEFQRGLKELYPGYEKKLQGTPELVDWRNKPFIKTGYMSPKKADIFKIAKALYEPFLGRLFFAGEHTQMDFFGYMEGALQSGRRAANTLVKQVCPQARGPLEIVSINPVKVASGSGARLHERSRFEREIADLDMRDYQVGRPHGNRHGPGSHR